MKKLIHKFITRNKKPALLGSKNKPSLLAIYILDYQESTWLERIFSNGSYYDYLYHGKGTL